MAGLAGVAERGSELIARLSARLAAVERPIGRPRVAVIEWLEPLFAPGHWVPEQVELAGGTSAIGTKHEPSRTIASETVSEADPQVVVLGLCGFDLARTLEEWAEFRPPDPLTRTSAWRDGEVWAMDGSAYVSRPGSRLVDGVEILSTILAGRPDPRAVAVVERDTAA